MKKKYSMFMFIICIFSLLMSGCFFKDVTNDITEADGEKIVGEWYDSETKNYFKFNKDLTFINGHGLKTENIKGHYTLTDNQIILRATGTNINDEYETIPDDKQEDIIMDYNFSYDVLNLKKGQHRFSLSRITSNEESNQINKKTDYQLKGLFKCNELTLFYYFMGDNKITISSKSTNPTFTGTYELNNNELIIVYEEIEEIYQFKFIDEQNFSLTDKDGNVYTFTLV